MTRGRRCAVLAALLAALALILVAAGCGGDDESSSSTGGGGGGGGEAAPADVKGNISVTAVWSGQEQASFKAVIDAFNQQYPDVRVRYNSAGDQLPTVVSTAVQGGNPPDIAVIAQPGLVSDFAKQGALKPIEFARDTVEQGFAKSWVDLGTVDGKLYGVFYKGANKSTGWYNTRVWEDAGVSAPESFEQMVTDGKTIQASGVPAWSVGGANGWTLTDLFENIYLRSAGPEKYDQLAAHDIPWTDPSVKEALRMMAQLYDDPSNIAGGVNGALQTEFPASVSQVFTDPPKAGTILEGDFVASTIADETDAKPQTDFGVFGFPPVNGSPPAVMGAGDEAVMFKDSPGARAFMEYLATPEAARIWAARGGYSSPNRNLDPSVYPDDITRQTASDLAEAETFRFDMSDLQPAAFGGTDGQGLWKAFQDFLRSPDDIDGVTQQMEAGAKRAYRSS